MCGLFFCYSKDKVDEFKFKESLLLQKHRGPDNTGIKKINNNIIFGHVRLSTVDLSKASNQPMINETTSNILVFNGEIYNFIELKEKLKEANIVFKSNGDTEVLLHLLEKYGRNIIKELNGAYSFVFYNSTKNSIIVSRDRFGKKPLYYYEDDNNIIISSEIKSIFNYTNKSRVLRKSYLKSFIDFNYLSNENEETLYHDIKQFLPGTITEIQLKNKFLKKEFYDNRVENFLNFDSGLSFKKLLDDSVKIRLRSDVKTAVLVSGGIDSSIVASIAKKYSNNLTFVKGYFGEDEDHKHAKELEKNLNLDLINIPMQEDSEKIIGRIKKITKFMEAPIPILGITIASNILYEKISEMGIKVVLDGNGGDEVFAGYTDRYTRYYLNSCIEDYKLLDILRFVYNKKNYNIKFETIMKYLVQKIFNKFFNISFKEKIFDNTRFSLKIYNSFTKINFFETLDKYQIWDIVYGPCQRMLKIWDNAVMMNSVEARSPLLDFRNIKFMNKNNNQKFNKGYNKYKLRKEISKEVGYKIKYRRDKQPLKWNFVDKIFEEKFNHIEQQVRKSKLVKSCLNDSEVNEIFNFKNFKLKKDKILRLYSVSILGEVYDCNAK